MTLWIQLQSLSPKEDLLYSNHWIVEWHSLTVTFIQCPSTVIVSEGACSWNCCETSRPHWITYPGPPRRRQSSRTATQIRRSVGHQIRPGRGRIGGPGIRQGPEVLATGDRQVLLRGSNKSVEEGRTRSRLVLQYLLDTVTPLRIWKSVNVSNEWLIAYCVTTVPYRYILYFNGDGSRTTRKIRC